MQQETPDIEEWFIQHGPNVSKTLLNWFNTAKRPLPWRQTYEPYAVWISEIMLQQTQMERGVGYFTKWMERFPDIAAVAAAPLDDILHAWEGLGYYSRARNLHTTARRVVADFGGIFPDDPAAIRALPGIGEYTAAAIAAIAFNLPEPAVDANVLRIFSRLVDINTPPAARIVRDRVTEAVRRMIPYGTPRDLVQALMEFGALVCTKSPRCDDCPVACHCLALTRGTVSLRPVKPAPAAIRDHQMVAAILVHDNRIVIRQRPSTGLWAGLWEFPDRRIADGEKPETAVVSLLEDIGAVASDVSPIATVRHGYTTNRVEVHGFICHVAGLDLVTGDGSGAMHRWVEACELGSYAFQAGHRKMLEGLGWK